MSLQPRGRAACFGSFRAIAAVYSSAFKVQSSKLLSFATRPHLGQYHHAPETPFSFSVWFGQIGWWCRQDAPPRGKIERFELTRKSDLVAAWRLHASTDNLCALNFGPPAATLPMPWA